MKKTTEKILNEIQQTDNISRYIQENSNIMQTVSLVEFLNQVLKKYNKLRKDVIHESGLCITYGYQMFDGKKNPKRDKIIQLAFGFPMTVDELQQALRSGNTSELYPRNKRDALIIYALSRKMSVEKCNELLEENREEPFEMFC